MPRASRLAAVLALAAATPSAAAVDAFEPDCDGKRAQVRSRLAAEHQACRSDLDCVPWEPELMGCSGWISRATRPGEALALDLERACAGVPSSSTACPAAVGACVRGRCAPSPVAAPRRGECEAARRALVTRVSDTGLSCEDNEDCAAPILPGESRPIAAARAWPDLAARELRAVEVACALPAADPVSAGEVVPVTSFPACAHGRCRLLTDTPSAARWRRPALESPVCMHSATQAVAGRGPVTVHFTVGKTGRAFAIRFDPPTAPDDVQRALRDAIAGCRFRPGATAAEDPARIEVVLPLRGEAR